ncbi:MAG: hypothetical protein RSG95_01830 [Bacilli bacterium]
MMKIENNINYSIISNNINKTLLDKFCEYTLVDGFIKYDELVSKISYFKNKTIVFNDVLRSFSNEEKESIIDLLMVRKINFINITSNMEELLLSDYIFVFNNDELVLEGKVKDVLKEEKILKRIGFSLPFIVDLSTQLKLYGVISEVSYNERELVSELWK